MFSKVGIKVFWAIIKEKHFFGLFVLLKFSVQEKKAQIWANFHKARTKYFKITFFASQIAWIFISMSQFSQFIFFNPPTGSSKVCNRVNNKLFLLLDFLQSKLLELQNAKVGIQMTQKWPLTCIDITCYVQPK